MQRFPYSWASFMVVAPAVLSAALFRSARAQDTPVPGPGHPTAYELRCRGGNLFAFDTLGPAVEGAALLRMSLSFSASRRAAGRDGQGLEPGTCSWIDRPLNAQEPPQVWFTQIRDGVVEPRSALRDPDQYWSFLAYNTGRGHLEAVGQGPWTATGGDPAETWSQPPVSSQGYAQGRGLPFNPLYFLLFGIAWTLIAWIPSLRIVGRWSGWHRLADHYPASPVRQGHRIRCGVLVMGRRLYRGMARLTADVSQLHVSMMAPFRPGHPPFSVPWSDISVSRDQWPWFPFSGFPMIRLTLARDPGVRLLVRADVGKAIIAASGGRLRLSQSPADSEGREALHPTA